ncbi:MAG: stage II sporulation protein P, partial [Bacillota bacterium]|nr:stage II sporulation protein P [Bacillota bacterium]
AFGGIKAMLKKYPSISVVIDLHRDAINSNSGEKIKLTGDVNGEKAAQIMLVVGTDECGFSHPHWRDNLKFATMLQSNLIECSPSLARPIDLRTSRFNQQFTRGSLIVEVGTNGNTLDEALVSAKYLANALNATIKEIKKG